MSLSSSGGTDPSSEESAAGGVSPLAAGPSGSWGSSLISGGETLVSAKTKAVVTIVRKYIN